MKRIIIAISTTIDRKTHYIKSETQAANGEITVEFTTRPEEIREYETHSQAYAKLPKIRNPFAREYRVETVAVWHKKPVANYQTDLR
jgi:hypothetical protein